MAAFAQMTCICVGFVLIFLTTAVRAGEFPGAVKFENCYNAYIDTPKNGNITLVCTGFNPNDTVVWSIKKTDSTMFIEVARCDPSNCTVSQPEPFTVQRSPSSSHIKLFFHKNNTSLDRDVEVECKSTIGNRDTSDICKYNVIDTLPKTTEENRLPTEVIVGIVLGAVAGIILGVVVIRIVIVKLRRQEPAGRAHMPGNPPIEENEADTTYETPRRRQNAEAEHVYADLQNTPTMSTPSPQTNNSPESVNSTH